MFLILYPTQDTTIHEAFPTKNFGSSEILKLQHDHYNSKNYNSRILMQFSQTQISESFARVTGSFKTELVLHSTDAVEIPYSYQINVGASTKSWAQGTGRFYNEPNPQDGATWTYTNIATTTRWFPSGSGTLIDGNRYEYQNSASTSLASYYIYEGGGQWYTGSNMVASQSFEDSVSTDLKFDVTNIVNTWVAGTNSNYGFLIKLRNNEEVLSSSFTLNFFSKNTHTIYPPKLIIYWDDSSFTTGSLTAVDTTEELTLYIKNMPKNIREGSEVIFRLVGREKFPNRSWIDTNPYATVAYLPSTTYFAIYDTVTDEQVIPFNDIYTKVSCDSSGNFFRVNTSGLMPERFYKFVFKVVSSDGQIRYFDDNKYKFKVVR